MYTQNIELTEITENAFREIEQEVKPGRCRDGQGYAYFNINTPINSTNYLDLLFNIADHQYAQQLCIRVGSHWEKEYVRKLNRNKIMQFAEMAKQVSQKRNYLEIKFEVRELNDHPEMVGMNEKRAIIGFGEFDGSIVGFEMRMPHLYRWLFDVDDNESRYKIGWGIWAPLELKEAEKKPTHLRSL